MFIYYLNIKIKKVILQWYALWHTFILNTYYYK